MEHQKGGFDRLLETATLIVFTTMFGVVLLQVLLRYFLHLALGWAEELAGYLCVWTVFLAAAIATKRNQHIVIAIMLDRLPNVARCKVVYMIQVVVAAFLVLVIWGSLLMVRNTWEVRAFTIPIIRGAYAYLGITVGSSAMLFYLLVSLWKDRSALTFRKTGGEGPK